MTLTRALTLLARLAPLLCLAVLLLGLPIACHLRFDSDSTSGEQLATPEPPPAAPATPNRSPGENPGGIGIA